MKTINTLVLTLIFIKVAYAQEKVEYNVFDIKTDKSPNLLGKNLISTGLNEFNAVFTPDMKEFYFSIRHRSDFFVILKCDIVEGIFEKPQIASFSGKYMDADPFITQDGRFIYFCSNRPTHQYDTVYDWNIWRLERKDNEWANPTALSFNTPHKNEMYPTTSANGNIYFHSDLESDQKSLDFMGTNIYKSNLVNGEYKGYEKVVPISSDDYPEWDPFISPNEDYLIFTSPRPDGYGGGDMYISFLNGNKEWSKPKNMGEKINSSGMDYCPSLSPDGKILFFSSYRNNLDFSQIPQKYNELVQKLFGPENGNGDIYFIDSSIINDIKRFELFFN